MHKAELNDGFWQVFANGELVLKLPGWVPFGVVNRMVADFTRLDASGILTEDREYWLQLQRNQAETEIIDSIRLTEN